MNAEYGETVFYTTRWLPNGMSLRESIRVRFVLRAHILGSKVSEALGKTIGVAFTVCLNSTIRHSPGNSTKTQDWIKLNKLLKPQIFIKCRSLGQASMPSQQIFFVYISSFRSTCFKNCSIIWYDLQSRLIFSEHRAPCSQVWASTMW